MGNAASTPDERGGGGQTGPRPTKDPQPSAKPLTSPHLAAGHMRLPSLDVGESFPTDLLNSTATTTYEDYVPRPSPSNEPSALDGFVTAPSTPKRISIDPATLANYVAPSIGPYGPRSPTTLSRASTTRQSITSSAPTGLEDQRRLKRSSTTHSKVYSIDLKDLENYVPPPIGPYRSPRDSVESTRRQSSSNLSEPPTTPLSPTSPTHDPPRRTKVVSIDLKDLEHYVAPPIGPYRSPRESGESSRRISINTVLFDPPVGQPRNPLAVRSSAFISSARGEPIIDPNHQRERQYSMPTFTPIAHSPSSSDDTGSEISATPTSSVSTVSSSFSKDTTLIPVSVDSQEGSERSSSETAKTSDSFSSLSPSAESGTVAPTSPLMETVFEKDELLLVPVDSGAQQSSTVTEVSAVVESAVVESAVVESPSLSIALKEQTVPSAPAADVLIPVPAVAPAPAEEFVERAELTTMIRAETVVQETTFITVDVDTAPVAPVASEMNEDVSVSTLPTASVIEPVPTASVIELVPTASVIESTSTAFIIEPVSTASVIESVPAEQPIVIAPIPETQFESLAVAASADMSVPNESTTLPLLSHTSSAVELTITTMEVGTVLVASLDDSQAVEIEAESSHSEAFEVAEEPAVTVEKDVILLDRESVSAEATMKLLEESPASSAVPVTLATIASVAIVEPITLVGIDVVEELETNEVSAPIAESTDVVFTQNDDVEETPALVVEKDLQVSEEVSVVLKPTDDVIFEDEVEQVAPVGSVEIDESSVAQEDVQVLEEVSVVVEPTLAEDIVVEIAPHDSVDMDDSFKFEKDAEISEEAPVIVQSEITMTVIDPTITEAPTDAFVAKISPVMEPLSCGELSPPILAEPILVATESDGIASEVTDSVAEDGAAGILSKLENEPASVVVVESSSDDAPVPEPVALVQEPAATLVSESVIAPIPAPVVVLVPEPAVALVSEPAVALVSEPAFALVSEPAVTPVPEPVVAPLEELVVAPVPEPVVVPLEEPVVAPLEEPVVAPVSEPVVTPLAEPLVAPLAESVVTPLVESVVAPLAESVVTPPIEPAVAPLVNEQTWMAPPLPKRKIAHRILLKVDPASLVILQDMMKNKKLEKQINSIPRVLWPAFYLHLLASLDAKSRAVALLPPSSSPFDAVTVRPKRSKRKQHDRNKSNLQLPSILPPPSSPRLSATASAVSTPPLESDTGASTPPSSPTHSSQPHKLVIDITINENEPPVSPLQTPTTPTTGSLTPGCLTPDCLTPDGLDDTEKYPTLAFLIPAAAAALSANSNYPSTAFGRALTRVRTQLYTKRLKEKYLGREWIRLALHLGIGEGGQSTGRTKAIAEWYEWRFERLKIKVEEMEERVNRLRELRIQADLEEEQRRKEEEAMGLISYGRQEPMARIVFTLGRVVPPKRV